MLLDEVNGDISFKLSFEDDRSDALDIEDLLDDSPVSILLMLLMLLLIVLHALATSSHDPCILDIVQSSDTNLP